MSEPLLIQCPACGASRFQVRNIPTLLVLNRGQEVDRIVGVQPRAKLIRRLERAAA